MNVSRRWGLVLALVAGAASAAGADPAASRIVLDWNTTTLQVAPPPAHPRALAMVHVAMFDAVNAIEPRYEPYLALPTVSGEADVRAAAAAAAYGVLVRLYPAQQTALGVALAASLADVPEGASRTAGIAVGDGAAAAMVTSRATDNWLSPNPVYVQLPGPAAYRPTPPAFVNPVNVAAASFAPFVMAGSGDLRPNGPPAIESARFLEEYEEVRAKGAACPDPAACARSEEETMIARWHTEQAFPQFCRIARTLAAENPADLGQTSRTFALLSLAMADGFVAVFEAKYAFNFVRPITAIRAGDTDGVPETAGDAGWSPLLSTPPHPEYPSAHSVIHAAAAEVIKKMFGNHAGFDATAPPVPGLTRRFADADEFVADGQAGRIYGGMHFRTAVVEGGKTGRKVGKLVLERALLPLD